MSETIADIVREMYDYDGVVEEFAMRIEAAANCDKHYAAQCKRLEEQYLKAANGLREIADELHGDTTTRGERLRMIATEAMEVEDE